MTFEESFGYLCMETQTSGNEVFSFEDLENYCHDVWNAAVEETKRKACRIVESWLPGDTAKIITEAILGARE